MPSFVRLCIAAVDKRGHFSRDPTTSPSNRPRPRIPHLPHPSLPFALFLSALGSLTSPYLTQFRAGILICSLPGLLGLDVDGIYRVSGNLAVVQKLRFLVDRGEKACGHVAVLRISCLRTTGSFSGSWRNKEVWLEQHVLALDLFSSVLQSVLSPPMGGMCSQNSQDKVLTWKAPQSLKTSDTLPAPSGSLCVPLLGGLSPSPPQLPCPPVDLLGISVVCLNWIFSQTPDLSVSGSLWPFMSPEPLCTSFSSQKAD